MKDSIGKIVIMLWKIVISFISKIKQNILWSKYRIHTNLKSLLFISSYNMIKNFSTPLLFVKYIESTENSTWVFFLDTAFSYLGDCYVFQFLFLLKKNCIYKIYFSYSFENLYFFQHSLLGCSQYCGLKVLFTNLIRKLKNNDIFEGSDSQGILILFCLGYQYLRDSKYKTVLYIVTASKQAEYKNYALRNFTPLYFCLWHVKVHQR